MSGKGGNQNIQGRESFQTWEQLRASKAMDLDFQDHTTPTGPILQILPAEPGWEAVYYVFDSVQKKIVTKRLPLACWAVVLSGEVDEYRFFVIGMVRRGPELISLTEEFADGETPVGEVPLTFLGYNYPNCETFWDKLAEVTYREGKHKRHEKQEASE